MLKGNNIYLRTIEPNDADVIWRWENDTSLWRVSNTKAPFSKKLILDYVNSAQDIDLNKQIRFMIVDSQTEKLLGTLDFFEYDSFHQRVGVGILIANKEDRKKGIASESIQLGLEYIFETLCVKSVFCNILEDNIASQKLFEKIGFEKIGEKQNWFRTNHGWLNELMYQKMNTGIK